MTQHKHISDPTRALWATPTASKKGSPSRLLFWKRTEDKTGEPSPQVYCNPAIKASKFPELKTQHNPEWRQDPSKFLKPYCQPVVIEAIQSIPKQATCKFQFVNILRVDSSFAPILNVLNLPPTTADRYVPLLEFFFTKGEVRRISDDMENLKLRIAHLQRGRLQDNYTWWDMIRGDLDEVCDRAVEDYYAREEQMWIVPRLVHRCRRVNCSDQYRHRGIKEWRWKEKQWWLEITFPRAGKSREAREPIQEVTQV